MSLLEVLFTLLTFVSTANANLVCSEFLRVREVENVKPAILNSALEDLRAKELINFFLTKDSSLAGPMSIDTSKIKCGGICAINLMQGVRHGQGLALADPREASEALIQKFDANTFRMEAFGPALSVLSKFERDIYGTSVLARGHTNTRVLDGLPLERSDSKVDMVSKISINSLVTTNPQILTFVAVSQNGLLNGHAVIPLEVKEGNTLVVMDPVYAMAPVTFTMKKKRITVGSDGVEKETIMLVPENELAQKVFLSFFPEGSDLDAGELWVVSTSEFESTE